MADDGGNVTLQIGGVVIFAAIVGEAQRISVAIVDEVNRRSTIDDQAAQRSAIIDILIGVITIRCLGADAVGVVGILPRFRGQLDFRRFGIDGITLAVRDLAAVPVTNARFCHVEAGNGLGSRAAGGGIGPGAAAVGADLPLVRQSRALCRDAEADRAAKHARVVFRLHLNGCPVGADLAVVGIHHIAAAVGYLAAVAVADSGIGYVKAGDGIRCRAYGCSIAPTAAAVAAHLPLVCYGAAAPWLPCVKGAAKNL